MRLFDPRPGRLRRLQLPALLGRDQRGDLALDRVVEALLLPDLRLDGVLGRRALSDDLLLLGLRVRELRPVVLHGGAERLHLRQHGCILRADALRAVEAVEHVVQAAGAEDHLERRGLI